MSITPSILVVYFFALEHLPPPRFETFPTTTSPREVLFPRTFSFSPPSGQTHSLPSFPPKPPLRLSLLIVGWALFFSFPTPRLLVEWVPRIRCQNFPSALFFFSPLFLELSPRVSYLCFFFFPGCFPGTLRCGSKSCSVSVSFEFLLMTVRSIWVSSDPTPPPTNKKVPRFSDVFAKTRIFLLSPVFLLIEHPFGLLREFWLILNSPPVSGLCAAERLC